MLKCHLLLQSGRWVLLQEGCPSPLKTFASREEGVLQSLSYLETLGGSLMIHDPARKARNPSERAEGSRIKLAA